LTGWSRFHEVNQVPENRHAHWKHRGAGAIKKLKFSEWLETIKVQPDAIRESAPASGRSIMFPLYFFGANPQ
jgi:hypothetical protein